MKAAVDLTEKIGLPVKLVKAEEGWQLEIGDEVLHEKPAVRLISDLKPVMKNPQANTPNWLYWMYRNVRLPKHEKQISESGLRYDLTVFNPGVLCIDGKAKDGDEWNKAAGHYHPYARSGVTFPEVYEVVYGQVMFLLQFVDDVFAIPPKVNRFVILEVQAGDLVVIPPNCAHIAVIPNADEPVVTSNWVARAFDSQYTPIRLMKGAAYYIVKSGEGYTWERNPSYPEAPEPEVVKGYDWEKKNLPTGIPAYEAFFEDPKAFEFLVKP
ncbi:MAG: hypothetical protein NZ805_03905 [Armatimonadetes bacterium]|nr:hypothetical protein [Armatimonadota bacterium]MDW8028840.1 glucose-6-phosphate isomerase family protein [Armatimonadota bacterium]